MSFLINPYVFFAVDLPHFDETILLVNSEGNHLYDDSYGYMDDIATELNYTP